MFKITQSPTFWAKVRTATTDESGRRVTGEFEIKCKRLGRTEARDLLDRFKESETFDADFLNEVVVDWRGVGGNDGALPFSEAALRGACDGGFGADMMRAFQDALPGAKAKN